jgi:predicted HTH domain antitoxin
MTLPYDQADSALPSTLDGANQAYHASGSLLFSVRLNMRNTVVTLDPEWVNTLRPLDNRPLDHFVKELAVLELYRRRQISSGKAAELLKMERMEFVRFASRQGIAFYDLSDEEFADEMELLSEAL